ncbi:MAG: hypothetical protein ACRDJE_27120 [Dehalococcoidia bacterium]
MEIPLQPVSYLIFAVVITVTTVTTGIILYAMLTGKTGDPGVERDE